MSSPRNAALPTGEPRAAIEGFAGSPIGAGPRSCWDAGALTIEDVADSRIVRERDRRNDSATRAKNVEQLLLFLDRSGRRTRPRLSRILEASAEPLRYSAVASNTLLHSKARRGDVSELDSSDARPGLSRAILVRIASNVL